MSGLVTVEEFLRMPPAEGGQYELHHGKVVLIPWPRWGHSTIRHRLRTLFANDLGKRDAVFPGMAFQPLAEHEVWVAHVGFVRSERASRVGDDEYLWGAPDLVVEVLSPGNTVDEINDKISVCLANGCLSFWVVDPKRERVSVTEGDVTRHYGVEGSASSELIGVSVPVREIFTPDSAPAL